MPRFAFSSLVLAGRTEFPRVGLRAGLLSLFLCSAAGAVQAQPSKDASSASKRTWQTHVVAPGESLGAIAARYRVRVSHLVEWNKIKDPDKIAVGKSLRVFAPPAPGSSPSKSSSGLSKPLRPAKKSGKTKGNAEQSEAKPSTTKRKESPSSGAKREGANKSSKTPASNASESSTKQTPDAGAKASAKKRVKALPSLSDPPAWSTTSKPRPNNPGTSHLRLHTLPTRPRSFAQRSFIFAMSDHRGSFDGEQRRSWWERRKDRRKARRARRFAAKRERALAEQRAGKGGSSHYEPNASLASSSSSPKSQVKRKRPARRTPNPARPGRALSVGLPNKGKLVRGIQLKTTNWYTVRTPEETWGSSNTINLLHHALVRFRENSKYKRELIVQDISKKGGGKFSPHKSHQSGRDVDIRLPVNRHVAPHGVPRKIKEVDWAAAWVLVHELIKSGEVEYIFLNYDRQKHLYRAAKRAGVSKKLLARWIQYPTHSKSQRSGLVRHVKGHSVHIHVRFRCGKQERRCRSK